MWRLWAIAVAIALVAAACGNDDDGPEVTLEPSDQTEATPTEEAETEATEPPPVEPTPTPTPEPTPTPTEGPTPTATPVPEPSAVAVAYFEAFTPQDVSAMEGMLDSSLPGSGAHAYAIHQVALSSLGDPLAPDAEVTSVNEDSIEVCDVATGTPEGCTLFADFIADADTGLLTSFTVAGVPVSERVLLGAGTATPGQGADAVISLVTAYHSPASDVLFVIVDVTNNTPVALDLSLWSAAYVDPAGRQHEEIGYAQGSSSVVSGATARAGVAFQGAGLGGTLFVEGFTAEDFTEVRFEQPVT